ncbi:MAG: hypothetical protein DRZ80_02225 [Thermoprotei archaeon]|nr:MAG: hypothetical protein DRZ80_02225 [Thermoprotei archaeon]
MGEVRPNLCNQLNSSGSRVFIKGSFSEKYFYLIDDYAREIDATILSFEKTGENEYIFVFDRTIFYPGGGHQPYDTGKLTIENNEFIVFKVERKGDEIYHYARVMKGDAQIDKGQRVNMRINWEKRYHMMKLHTAEHIFMKFIRERGYELEGGSWGPDEGLIIFSEELPIDILLEAENKTNEIIGRNLPVFRIIKNGYITIKIADFDERPCGGNHVSATGEIGFFKITKIERRGKTIRFNVGEKALNYLAKHYNDFMKFGLDTLMLRQEISPNTIISKLVEIATNLQKSQTEAEILSDILTKVITSKVPETGLIIGEATYNGVFLDLSDLNLSPKYLKNLGRRLQEASMDKIYAIKLSKESVAIFLKRSKKFFKAFKNELIKTLKNLSIEKEAKISSIEGGILIIAPKEKIEKIVKKRE